MDGTRRRGVLRLDGPRMEHKEQGGQQPAERKRNQKQAAHTTHYRLQSAATPNPLCGAMWTVVRGGRISSPMRIAGCWRGWTSPSTRRPCTELVALD